jgi:uncharacterized protein (TIGR02266 family)
MSEERRSTLRARVPGVRVTYESAAGERLEAEVLDIGKGGLFIRSASPIPVGKRFSLELRLVGDPTSWSALGRVVWTRDATTADRPSGMGVKLIDAEDSMLAAIEKVVSTREPTAPGVGTRPAPPPRERTVLGVGASGADKVPAAPVIAVPSRERTVLGVGTGTTPPRPEAPRPEPARPEPPNDVAKGPPREPEKVPEKAPEKPLAKVPAKPPEVAPAKPPPTPVEPAPVKQVEPAPVKHAETAPEEQPDSIPEKPPALAPVREPAREPVAQVAVANEPLAAPARDASIAVDLVPKKPAPTVPQTPLSEASLAAAGVPRRRRGGGWLVLLIFVAALVVLYFMRDRIPLLQSLIRQTTMNPQPPTPTPPPPSVTPPPSASTPPPAASASATTAASATSSATAAASAASTAPSSSAASASSPAPSASKMPSAKPPPSNAPVHSGSRGGPRPPPTATDNPY